MPMWFALENITKEKKSGFREVFLDFYHSKP
jgi:hypothetical protein